MFHNDWTDTTSDHLPEYKEAYLKQQSVQKKEKEIEGQLKKQLSRSSLLVSLVFIELQP